MIIIRYNTQQDAEHAVTVLDGLSLDKAHNFKVLSLDAFDAAVRRKDQFVPTTSISWFSRKDFRDWLNDKKSREQFMIRYHDQTEVWHHDMVAGTPELVYGGAREKAQGKIWCDWVTEWSPRGSYLATYHKQGIALWAGETFLRVARAEHEGVKFMQFSPTEDFLLTWNGTHASENDENAVLIHRVQTGEVVFKRRTPVVAPLGNKVNDGQFPHFLWSNDGQFFAECNESQVILRDTKTFDYLRTPDGKKRGLKFENLDTMQWSPKDNVLAVWTLEKNNNPARLVLVEVPSFNEITSRSRTQVEAEMHWQNNGDFLCLCVTKLSKTGKKIGTNLELFRMRERGVPVDVVEIKDTVRGFFWENGGNRFALITTDENGHKPKLQIWVLNKEKCEVAASLDLPGTSFTKLVWAPDGHYFVIAAIGHGDLLFSSVHPETQKIEILHKEEHFMVNFVQYSPCLRYVITAVCADMRDTGMGFKYSQESGMRIWTFQGRNVFTQQKEKLYGTCWRPRPPTLLSAEKSKNIRKNIKQFSKKYDALDDQAKDKARNEFKRDREERLGAFNAIMDRLGDFKREKEEENGWAEAREEFEGEVEWEKVEIKEETELDQTEELIST